MDPGQGGGQAGIAFVADDAQGAGRGDGEVGPADAHVGREEMLAQLFTGYLDQLADVGLLLFPGHLGEQVRHLLAGEMDGGHDHMGRPFVAQLDDPFAQVRLHHLKSGFFQVVVEEGLLRGHGLGFEDFLDAIVPGDAGDDLVGLQGGGGQVDLDPGGLGLGLEGRIQLFQVRQGGIFAGGDLPGQGRDVHPGEEAALGLLVGGGEGAHGGAQKLVTQGLLQALLIFLEVLGGVDHGINPSAAADGVPGGRAPRGSGPARCRRCGRPR